MKTPVTKQNALRVLNEHGYSSVDNFHIELLQSFSLTRTLVSKDDKSYTFWSRGSYNLVLLVALTEPDGSAPSDPETWVEVNWISDH